jgi:hypothetical protein
MPLLRTFFLILLVSLATAQTPRWDWAVLAGGSSGEETVLSICSDTHDNVIAVINFDRGFTLGKTVYPAGTFVVKYTSGGTILWAVPVAGDLKRVTCDGADNIYVAANYEFEVGVAGITLPKPEHAGIFILHLDARGELIWHREITCDDVVSIDAFTADDDGNTYLAGYSWGSTLSWAGYKLENRGPFLLKCDKTGSPVWGTSGPVKPVHGLSIAVDELKNVYVGGYGSPEPCEYFCELPAIYIVDKSGELTRWEIFDKSMHNAIYDLRVDGDGNVVTIENRLGNHSADYYLVKYDQFLETQWTKPSLSWWGTLFLNVTSGLTLDRSDNMYLAGVYGAGESYEDSLMIENTWLQLRSERDRNILVMKVGKEGNTQWIMSAGGSGRDGSEWSKLRGDICLNTQGDLLLASSFRYPDNSGLYTASDSCYFGETYLQTSEKHPTAFLAKLSTGVNTAVSNRSMPAPVLFPNPCSSTFQMTQGDEFRSVVLTDIRGVTVRHWLPPFPEEFNIGAIPDGIYFLRVEGDTRTFTQKLVVRTALPY